MLMKWDKIIRREQNKYKTLQDRSKIKYKKALHREKRRLSSGYLKHDYFLINIVKWAFFIILGNTPEMGQKYQRSQKMHKVLQNRIKYREALNIKTTHLSLKMSLLSVKRRKIGRTTCKTKD